MIKIGKHEKGSQRERERERERKRERWGGEREREIGYLNNRSIDYLSCDVVIGIVSMEDSQSKKKGGRGGETRTFETNKNINVIEPMNKNISKLSIIDSFLNFEKEILLLSYIFAFYSLYLCLNMLTDKVFCLLVLSKLLKSNTFIILYFTSCFWFGLVWFGLGFMEYQPLLVI